MCDYSLQNVKSRPAKIGDKLTARNFGTGTIRFAASEDANVAVCLLPGQSCPLPTRFSVTRDICGLGKIRRSIIRLQSFGKLTRKKRRRITMRSNFQTARLYS